MCRSYACWTATSCAALQSKPLCLLWFITVCHVVCAFCASLIVWCEQEGDSRLTSLRHGPFAPSLPNLNFSFHLFLLGPQETGTKLVWSAWAPGLPWTSTNTRFCMILAKVIHSYWGSNTLKCNTLVKNTLKTKKKRDVNNPQHADGNIISLTSSQYALYYLM